MSAALQRVREACAEIRRTASLSSIVGRSLSLKRAGREWKALCPFHKERSPSFTIYDDDRRWHCFGCGAGGDQLDFVRMAHGVSVADAIRMIDSGALPVVAREPSPAATKDRTRNRDKARSIWRAALPVAGTPAETYLRWRGLFLPIPASIRFARLRYPRGPVLPCLVALVASADNRLAGIHRIYLKEDGRGKADVEDPKLSLGPVSGGAIRLAPAAGELIVCEGLEDGLTLMQETRRAVWAAAGSGTLAKMGLPDGVQRVVIGRDNDAPGMAAAARAAEWFAAGGRQVCTFAPLPGFKDFNAELEGTSW